MVEHPLPVLGFSNSAPFKTSDQANAIKWLAYMFVYEREGLLTWGARSRARGCPQGGGLRPRHPHVLREGFDRIPAEPGRQRDRCRGRPRSAPPPERLLVRFRHPRGLPIRSVRVNGAAHARFDARRGDVEIDPAAGGAIHIVASYG